MTRKQPPADFLRDARVGAQWARVNGFKLTQSWRWHCEAWPDDAVSYRTWQRYWADTVDEKRAAELREW